MRCAHTLPASQFSRRGGILNSARERRKSWAPVWGALPCPVRALRGAPEGENGVRGAPPTPRPPQWELWVHCFRDVLLPNISCPSRHSPPPPLFDLDFPNLPGLAVEAEGGLEAGGRWQPELLERVGEGGRVWREKNRRELKPHQPLCTFRQPTPVPPDSGWAESGARFK